MESISRCAIEAALTIRMVFHLPLRQTEGFLRSLAQMLDVDLPIPDHTTLSRRLQKLGEIQFHKSATTRPMHLLIDTQASGFMSAISVSHRGTGHGESCTWRSMRKQARSSPPT